jgi:hypothetical protein
VTPLPDRYAVAGTVLSLSLAPLLASAPPLPLLRPQSLSGGLS